MTRRCSAALAVAACALLLASCRSRQAEITTTVAAPPPTRIAPSSETRHGRAIVDDYRWLEADGDEVAAWTNAQNAYARSVLDALPGRAQLEKRLEPLVRIGSVGAPVVRGNRYFFLRRSASEDAARLYVRDGALGADRLLIDPARLSADGTDSLEWFVPSPDGRRLAVGVGTSAGPGATLRVLDVDGGSPVDAEIANVLPDVQWRADGSGFFYQRIVSNGDGASREAFYHRLSTPAAGDVPLFRAPADAPGLGPSASLSGDGRWIVLSYWRDAGSNDVWIARFDDFLKRRGAASQVVSAGAPGRALGTIVDGTLFLHTTKGAARGRVVAVSVAAPGQANWRDVVPERHDATIEAVTFGRGVMAVTYLERAASVVRVFDLTGRSVGTINQPGIGTTAVSASADRTEAFLTFSSFIHPPTVFRIDLANPSAAARHWGGPDLRLDTGALQVEQVSVTSKDGTAVSMFVASRKGQPRTGETPALLTGFGAGGVSMVPMFWGPFFEWIQSGGVLAVPNVRGGGEYGVEWQRAGSRDRKQHSADDMVAAAEWLIANRYTSPAKLALHATTHGAAVAAGAALDRPDLFRAVLLVRPVLDLLRYRAGSQDRFWAAEYDVDDPPVAAALAAYSPYGRVTAQSTFPAALLTAAEQDQDAHPFHARKMTAALQAAARGRPVLLRVDRPAADAAALLALELRDVVDQRAFLDWQLGNR